MDTEIIKRKSYAGCCLFCVITTSKYVFIYLFQALIQQEKDLTEQIKSLEVQLQQTVPDKNHLKQLDQKVKELERGFRILY